MNIRLVAVLAGSLAAAGCTSLVKPVDWPWSSAVPTCGGTCTEADARLALQAASGHCYQVMTLQGRRSGVLGGTRLGIGTVGAISGSVIAQFAQGAAAKAWAGVAGVASGMQTQLDQTFANVIDIKRRDLIAQTAINGLKRYEQAGSPDQKVERAIEMTLACSMNATSADGTILNMLTNRGGDPDDADPMAVSYTQEGSKLVLTVPYRGAATKSDADTRAKNEAGSICKAQGLAAAKASGPTNGTCKGSSCELLAKFECSR